MFQRLEQATEATSPERPGDEPVVIDHQRKQSVSISMPLSYEEVLPHNTERVFSSGETSLRDGIPISSSQSGTAGSKYPQPSKSYSQPMPKGYVQPEASHGVQISNHPGIKAFRDKRFDSFKTWSGTLERQLSILRGKSPRQTEEEDNNFRNTDRPVPVDRYFDALEGPELETLRVCGNLLPVQNQLYFKDNPHNRQSNF